MFNAGYNVRSVFSRRPTARLTWSRAILKFWPQFTVRMRYTSIFKFERCGLLTFLSTQIRGSKSKALHDQLLVNCQYSTATFSMGERKRRPRGDRKSTEMSAHLQQTFAAAIKTELFPRSQIDIFVEVFPFAVANTIHLITLVIRFFKQMAAITLPASMQP